MKKIFTTISLLVLLIPNLTFAAGLVPCGDDLNGNGKIDANEACTFCHFFVLLDNVIDFILTKIIPSLAILFLVIGGLVLLFAGGNPNLVSLGKKIITSVVIGFAIVYGSWLIVFTIADAMGVASWVGITSGGWSINCPTP